MVHIMCTSGDPFFHISTNCRKVFDKLFCYFFRSKKVNTVYFYVMNYVLFVFNFIGQII